MSKSKKQSATKERKQLSAPILFLDENYGRGAVTKELDAAKIEYVVLKDVLPRGSLDEKWIAEVGKNGWVAITRDNALKRHPIAKRSIADNGAQVVIIRAKGLNSSQLGELIRHLYKKISRYCEKNQGPFLISISKGGHIVERDLGD